ncbi:MAG: DUF192 domain-containing protein [Acidisphaera sp.]|nr:DUF192 domain-containing protein [Acidisphaera sp.]MBV9813597.1 DUF192 domain-containing protein [Acetobacteraceae bacterium]
MNRREALAALLLIPIAVAAQDQEPTASQPTLPIQALTIVTRDGTPHLFHVEMAISTVQQTTGLMFRPSVAPDGGMLFDWGAPRDSQMWMKNTVAPLDMLFINADGRIRRIAENTVPQSLAVIESGGPVRATLELAAGTAQRLDIRVGDLVKSSVFGNAG